MKKIIFTVSNDLSYDQRMQRICNTLANAGYKVLLVGRNRKHSIPLNQVFFEQKRIRCWFNSGKLFYAEYNLRLFFFLLFEKADCLCAIDLDTILPCYFVSNLKGIKRVYDAHEYFSQLNEVISRRFIYTFWRWIERKMIPRFKNGYTVCQSIAYEFEKMYKVKYQVIRNMPILEYHIPSTKKGNVILYQGAVNKGRGLAQLVEAMQFINAELWVCGNGNFMNDMRDAAIKFGVSNKIIFFGMLPPIELKKKAGKATIAVNPFEKVGLNQYLSLSNKFFDYIHADLPQVAMNYPEYIRINKEYEVALLINDLNPKTISHAINKLLSDNLYYEKLHNNCIPAKENLNWQNEELKLISFYNSIFK